MPSKKESKSRKAEHEEVFAGHLTLPPQGVIGPYVTKEFKLSSLKAEDVLTVLNLDYPGLEEVKPIRSNRAKTLECLGSIYQNQKDTLKSQSQIAGRMAIARAKILSHRFTAWAATKIANGI